MSETAKPPKILIVDDAAALRAVLHSLFVNEGFEVVGELASGAKVLDVVSQLQPDIVCLDYHLPDVSGMELLGRIHAVHAGVAVIMITGDANPELEGDAAEAGASGFIRKPFSPDQILKEIRQIIQLRKLHLEHGQGNPFAVNHARATAVIADDSSTMRMLLSSVLVHAGVNVVGEASDGKAAVELTAKHQPTIVFLDIDMPVMTGLEALEQIRAQAPSAKVLMVTGRADRELVAQAAKLGAVGYILKPFAPERIGVMIDKLLPPAA